MDPNAEQLIARLRRNPDDFEAFAALRAHYHHRADYASLANLLEGWAARSSDAMTAADAFYEAADICRERLSDRGRALSLYERTLERHPVHMNASMRLQEVFEQMGDHRRLLEILERRAEALEDAKADARHVAQTHQLMGEIWEQKMQRVDRAVGHYRRAFELDSSLVAAIYAAREIYRTAGNLKATASLYELEINAETDPERKVALLRELAHMRGEQLGDLEGAVAALKRAQSNTPTDLSVMHDLATVLLRRAESSADPATADADRRRAADLLYQMAQNVPADHAVAYAEAALDAMPGHDGALELFERLAAQTGQEEALPLRWVAFLQAVPDAPGSDQMRRRLGQAYLEAGQVDDAILCWEPLLERGDAEAAEALVDLYRDVGREGDRVRALSVAVAGMPPDKRIPRLREIIGILVSQGNQGDAAARAREILDIEPSDPEALAFLEDDCRSRDAWDELRDLLMAAARVPGLSVDARKQRLREVAAISVGKLGDPGGAISAWRAVATLDPADSEARKALERLLEEAERWDELVQVLERQALSLTDPDAKAEVYRRLAHIHRERRDSLMEAIDALRALRDIRPGDMPARNELCDCLLLVGAHLEAVPLLRQRIDGASAEERVDLLRRLAEVLETQIGDDEGAFDACTRLLDEEPGDLPTIERMERIDAQAENWVRLLETLSYKTDVVEPLARAAVFRTMGQIAEQHLGDLDRAAEYYVQTLDLRPDDGETLDALCAVYDRAERYRDLVVLLKARAKEEKEPTARAELFRRIARTLADRVRNEDAAAEAWHEVLAAGEDAEALRYLIHLADKRGETAELADLLRRAAMLESNPAARRDLLLERARLLAEHLDAAAKAIGVLHEIVESVEPNYPPALSSLVSLCEQVGDHTRLADALERQLTVTEDAGLRVPVARQLADLYEGVLDDGARAIAALTAWTDADFTDPAPQRRLARRLEASERWEELIDRLDSLAGIEQDGDEVGRLTRQAAELALEKLGDVDGAWSRLVARVEDGDVESEEMLRRIAREVARGEPLAELYVGLAQAATAPAEQARRWRDASKILEQYLADPMRALEASLRAFAVDLDDEAMLDEVDRLATEAGAGERLAQVYDTLLRRADDSDKVALLVRHAGHLESSGGDPSGALDRVLRACSLAPDDDEVLARAEVLAPRAGRADELLIVYDRRRARATDDQGRVEALLRAARLSDISLQNRDQALGFVAQAVSLSVVDDALRATVESTVRTLDVERPEVGTNAAQIALVDIYRRLAERAAEDEPETGALLLLHASRILGEELGDEPRAYQYLKQGASFAPESGSILDTLEEFAERTGRLEDLEQHLDRLVDEALDQQTAADLLRRRGRILEIELERFSDAADAWAQLGALRSSDPEVPRRLRHCLRKAGRHQDLLLVLDREVDRTDRVAAQLAILKEIATTWDEDLGNRWEAQDAWKRVLAVQPDDADAIEALRRLGHSTRKLTPDELESLDEDSGGISIGEADERVVPGPLSAPDGSGEHTDPGLEPAALERDLAFDDETDDEAVEPLLALLGGAGTNTDERAAENESFVEGPHVPWMAEDSEPGPVVIEEPTDPQAPAAAPIREITSELDLSDVEELSADHLAGGMEEFDASDHVPLSPSADTTGELDALDLIPYDEAVGEIHGLVELPEEHLELASEDLFDGDSPDVGSTLQEGRPSSVPPPLPSSPPEDGDNGEPGGSIPPPIPPP